MNEFKRYLVTWAVIFLALLASEVVEGQEVNYPKPVLSVGRTSHTIKKYYTHRPIVEVNIVKPKNGDYCPAESSDYQCPMDATGDGLNIKPEPIEEARKVSPLVKRPNK